ncbi:MAG: RidA family protein [Gemmatimonadetes bacterium]|nr:RidA family protein [Gemmatimonadota bacterium]
MSSTKRFRRSATAIGVTLSLTLVAGCKLVERSDSRAAQAAERPTAPPQRQIVQPEGVARLPVFSTAVRTGKLLFLSGQVGTKPGVSPPEVVEGGIEPETRQAFENIQTVLAAAGLGLEDLVKCTVFLADINDYAAMNSVYVTFFPNDPPARSAMAGSGLALGAKVEIECIAAYPAGA